MKKEKIEIEKFTIWNKVEKKQIKRLQEKYGINNVKLIDRWKHEPSITLTFKIRKFI